MLKKEILRFHGEKKKPLNIVTRMSPDLPLTVSLVLMDASIFNSDLRICSRRLKLNEGYHLLSHCAGEGSFQQSCIELHHKVMKQF